MGEEVPMRMPLPLPLAPEEQLQVTSVVVPPQLLVRLAGELDAFTAGLVEVPPVVSLQGVSDVRLDLEKLRFCDSLGLRALCEFRSQHVQAGRTVRILGAAHPHVLRVLRLTGLDALFLG